MSADLSGYTFTNGTKVTDWIATLPADDRERAAKVVEIFVTERKPLNMLQVKIRLATPAPSSPGEIEDGHAETPLPPPDISRDERHAIVDAYNSPGPIRPTAVAEKPVVTSGRSRDRRLMKFILAGVAAILALAVITNPSRQAHVDMLTETVSRATARSINGDTGSDADLFGGMFGLSQPAFPDDAIESLVHDVLESELEYHNYILWSTCTATVGYTEQTVTAGAFGMVRALDDDLTIN